MHYGINLLLWSDVLCDAVVPMLDDIKEIGFDAVELPVFEHDPDKYAAWGKHLDDRGLARTGVTIRGADDNPVSPDPAVRAKGVEGNKRAIDCCVAAGCATMIGPFHSALGVFTGTGPTEDEWKWGAESLRAAAEYADEVGIDLAIEPLNRFECYFLTTAGEAARLAREVDHPRCGVMYDTFHSHIEEKSTIGALRATKGLLKHVHISENDRSTPGSGNVRWDETFDTLHEIGYDGFLVIEAFGLLLEKLVPTCKIWRRMYESERQLAADGLAFMKEQVAQRW